jgi:RNA polymerase-binding transcription factor DksA
MDQLRDDLEEARNRRVSGEQYLQLAGEARDAGDDAVANQTVDAISADIRRDQQEFKDLDEALGRVAAGSYGICLRCGQPIEHARLEAYPAAKRHVECQEAVDKERGKLTNRTPTL